MSSLDKEAIQATIMESLFNAGLIDESTSLDLDNQTISPSGNGYHYQEHPFVRAIPEWIYKELRNKTLVISASIPVSLFISMHTGVHRCVYDMNTAVSSIFDDFTFILANYDSPTRPGIKAEKRPFLEVDIHGERYLVDVLTHRIYLSEEFKKKFNMEILDSISKRDFDNERIDLYQRHTKHNDMLGDYLVISYPIIETFINKPNFEQYRYEFAKVKELYPEAWEEKNVLKNIS